MLELKSCQLSSFLNDVVENAPARFYVGKKLATFHPDFKKIAPQYYWGAISFI